MNKADKEKFLEAYDQYAEAIYRHCFFRVFSQNRAEDLTQETFLRTWQYIAGGNNVENLRAFLYRVANNLIIDESRKKKEESLDALLEESPAFDPPFDEREGIEKKILLEDIRLAMRELLPQERDLLIMRYVDDLEPKEIAEILDISPNNVSVKLNRAVKALKEKYHPSGGRAEEKT